MKRIISYAVAAITVFLFAGESLSQNVAQVDFPGALPCPRPPENELLPDFKAILETSGRPVLLSYVVHFGSSPQGVLHLTPVIDGVRDAARQLDRALGDFLASGQADIVTFLRVYDLPKGVHTFELAASCQAAMQLSGWLTVYEIPKQGQRGGD